MAPPPSPAGPSRWPAASSNPAAVPAPVSPRAAGAEDEALAPQPLPDTRGLAPTTPNVRRRPPRNAFQELSMGLPFVACCRAGDQKRADSHPASTGLLGPTVGGSELPSLKRDFPVLCGGLFVATLHAASCSEQAFWCSPPPSALDLASLARVWPSHHLSMYSSHGTPPHALQQYSEALFRVSLPAFILAAERMREHPTLAAAMPCPTSVPIFAP